jgi:hypothetical protein
VWLAASVGVVCAAGGLHGRARHDWAGAGRARGAAGREAAGPRFGRFGTVVEVEYLRGHGTLGPLLRGLDERDGRVQNIVVEDDENDTTSDGVRHVTMQVSVRRPADLDEIVEHLGHRPEIRAVRVGTGETD